ncbi:AEC family transporter [Maritimibacter sp. UBA3975]|uniref:AEC family transporter n=1 Tax=Maritimibacter sp. UBA3975 TaxID=1946833 RepID=UPI000C0B12C6|nr:AEC family transporter [Maritimibacter sp. UBA3975]MAM60652.1 malonate transporter [Maritimibacter sp.]|tara:strand:+ start:5093 stop:6022 length:930 start_codon:yes stop_codon:yes gene_type:complete
MQALIEVILPVFLVLGFGYLASWKLGFGETAVQGLMKFAQNFAVPVLLFRALSTLDLGANFDPALLASFYTGAFTGFAAGLLGARYLFGRPWADSVAIGFATLFSNSVLLGLPIMERAYGSDALGPNYAIIAIHAPVCYVIGVTAMEIVRSGGSGVMAPVMGVARSMSRNPLVIGIALGILANVTNLTLPGPARDAVDLVARAALPAALFGLGGVLVAYRPQGDMRVVAWIVGVSLVLHPAVTWVMGTLTGLTDAQFRSAVLTAAMAPGVNAFLFANMYGVSKRVNATGVLVATATSILTIWLWLHALP